MALTQGSSASWADIMNLFDRALSEQHRFGLTPSRELNTNKTQERIAASEIQDLVDILDTLKSHESVGAAADTSEIIVPAVGTKIQPEVFNRISSVIGAVEDVCSFTSFSSCFSFGFCSFRGSYFDSNSNNFTGFTFNTTPCTFNSSSFNSSSFNSDATNFGFTFTGSYTNTGNYNGFTFSFSTNFARFSFSGSYANSSSFRGSDAGQFGSSHGTFGQFNSNNYNGFNPNSSNYSGFTPSSNGTNFGFNFNGSYNNSTNFGFSFNGSYNNGSNFSFTRSNSSNFSFSRSNGSNFGFRFTGSYRSR